MSELILTDIRGGLPESRHRVAAVVRDPEGRVVAQAGATEEIVFWRSAAKPFQLWPLVDRGGVAQFDLASRHLALACASHNAEPMHRTVAAEWLERIGLDESMLACGGHPSLSPAVAEQMIRDGVTATPIWSNCSGKHSAMLALAKLEGWPLDGYQQIDHPVQQAIAASIARWTDLDVGQLGWGVDGCTAAAVAAPLRRLALAWARLGNDDDPALATIRAAMLAHPELLAGTGRLDTVLMTTWPGRILVKVGAEGVYAATLPGLGLGIALKVEDGDMRAAGIALVAVLQQLLERRAPNGDWSFATLTDWHDPVIRNTRGAVTGQSLITGRLDFT